MTNSITIDGNKLDGCVPNDGAHRLAHWLKGAGRKGWQRLRMIGLGPSELERIWDGGLVPVDELAVAIARETEGAVEPADFAQGGGMKWAEPPRERQRAAA